MINKDKVSNNNEDKGDIKIKYKYINKFLQNDIY